MMENGNATPAGTYAIQEYRILCAEYSFSGDAPDPIVLRGNLKLFAYLSLKKKVKVVRALFVAHVLHP